MEHLQSIMNFIFISVSGVLGWFARELWSAVKSLKDDVAKLREEIANDRVHKDDFRQVVEQIMRKLDRIEDKLDHKADK